MVSDWRRGSCLTEDMSEFDRAKQEGKLLLFVLAHEGGFTWRQGKNSLDFRVAPARSCGVLSYLVGVIFLPCNVSSPGRNPGALASHGRALGRGAIWRNRGGLEECAARLSWLCHGRVFLSPLISYGCILDGTSIEPVRKEAVDGLKTMLCSH